MQRLARGRTTPLAAGPEDGCSHLGPGTGFLDLRQKDGVRSQLARLLPHGLQQS